MLMGVSEVRPLLQDSEAAAAAAADLSGAMPILVDFDRSVLSRERVAETAGASPVRRENVRTRLSVIKRLLSAEKRVTRQNLERLRALLHQRAGRPRVLVVGGGTVGQGLAPLYDDAELDVIAFDLYFSPDIHFVADAHDIPLRTGTVDAVIVQAILEHVLDPARVVAEIWRVLKKDGLVYSETPFLQHVHEGPYDFTRFTESGHRYLFRRFELIASGVCGGPGTQLMWSIDYFVRGLFRSWAAGKVAKLAFCWLQLLDRAVPEDYASDAASGFYFLGRRSAVTITPGDAVAFYRGAQRAR